MPQCALRPFLRDPPESQGGSIHGSTIPQNLESGVLRRDLPGRTGICPALCPAKRRHRLSVACSPERRTPPPTESVSPGGRGWGKYRLGGEGRAGKATNDGPGTSRGDPL